MVRKPVAPSPAITSYASLRQPVHADAERDVSKTIDAVIKSLRKQFGSDAVSRLDEYDSDPVDTFPTGLTNLDAALGIGGFPLSKLVQIAGPESVGKSTLCKKLIREAQAHGIAPYFIDGEDSRDTPHRYRALGLTPRTIAWSDALTIEQAFTLADAAILSLRKLDKPAMIFLDSIAAFLNEGDETRGYDEEGRRGAKAAFLSKNLKKLLDKIRGTQIGMVFVNQIREKANAAPFEDPTYEPGGRALRHYAHVTLRMKRLGKIRKGAKDIGIKSRIHVKKSKLSPPYQNADIAIYFDGRVENLDGASEGDDE